MELKDKIRSLRKAQGLTLEDVAKIVGVGKSTVRKWETGYIENMRRDKIAKLAEALHTTPAYLMGWEDEQKSESQAPALVNDDPELTELLERVRDDPKYRMLFSVAKDATAEDIEKAIKIIQALKGE